MINGFGITFGQYLVDTLQFEWKIVRDKYGTELAVYGMPGEIIVFPPNLVAKRYEKGESGFFDPLYTEISKTVSEVRRLPGDKR